MNDLALEYKSKVNKAKNFASGVSKGTPEFFALFKTGLILQEMELIPCNFLIKPEPYWVKLHDPATNEMYYIIPKNNFNSMWE